MQKKNVLIPISFNFQIRYIIRTGLLHKLSAFCNPIVVVFWDQEDLVEELKALEIECLCVHIQAPGSNYLSLRNKIDYYYQKEIVKSSTFNIRQDMKWKRMSLKGKIKHIIQALQRSRLLYNKKSFFNDINMLDEYVKKTDDFHQLSSILEKLNIRAILTTAPFQYPEEITCRVASQRNIPIFYCVLSFDNLTTRGYIPFIAEQYFVWNLYNKNEILRILPTLIPNKVSVTGPAQFDFYYDKQFIKNEQKWKEDKAIPEGRPVVLYGANAKFWVPNEYLIVKSIDEAITSGRISANPVVLLRPHPTDSFTDWENFASTCKNVFVEKSLEKNQTEDKMYNKFSNFTTDDVINLCSSLAHSAVHISYASTLALDGACFDKPQICPYFAPDNSLNGNIEIRNLFHSEHYTPIRLSGALDLPSSYEELMECINRALNQPELKANERGKLLNHMITHRDGKSTERIATKLEKLMSELV